MSLHQQLVAALDRIDPHRVTKLGKVVGAVLELHAPVTFMRHQLDVPICGACSANDDLHDVPAPCSTVQAIARELGIEATDHG